MKVEITKEKIKEICKTYPNPNICYPRGSFEEQLENHLRKYFGIKIKPEIKEDKIKGKKK